MEANWQGNVEIRVETWRRFQRLDKAARELIKDINRRYPGEELVCPYLIELRESLNG